MKGLASNCWNWNGQENTILGGLKKLKKYIHILEMKKVAYIVVKDAVVVIEIWMGY